MHKLKRVVVETARVNFQLRICLILAFSVGSITAVADSYLTSSAHGG